MADVVQLVSAVVHLADVTYLAVQLVRRLYKAQKGAQQLCQKVERLSAVVDNVKRYVESEQNSLASRPLSPHEMSIRQSVLESIQACEVSITALNRKLAPLLQDDHSITILTKLKFAFMEGAIKRHESSIEAQLQSLTLSLLILNGLNNDTSHNITHDSQETILEILHMFVYFMMNRRPSAVGVVTHATSSAHQTGTPAPLTLPAGKEEISNLSQLIADSLSMSRRPLEPSMARPIDEMSVQEIFQPNEQSQITVDSPLATAVKGNKGSVVSCLIEGGADITERDTEGWTLLHHAVFERAIGPLRALLSTPTGQSLDFLNAQNNYGQTALILAAEQAYSSTGYKIAETLIASGCDINIADKDDKTALYVVIAQTWDINRDKFARLLLEKDADPEVVRSLQNSRKYTATREVLYGA